MAGLGDGGNCCVSLNAVRPEWQHQDRAVMGADNGEDDEGGEGGAQAGVRGPRKIADPRMPSQDEVDQHNLTHLPYRSWCVHCVRGRGEATPHRRAERDEGAVPEVHMDYCFLGKADEEAQPILVVRERDTRMMLSFLVREKGAADTYTVNRVLAFLKEIGHVGNKLIVKCDQESSIKALAEKIATERPGLTMQEHSPVRSSGSNGVIERGIKEAEYQIRSMKSALDDRLGTNLGVSSNVLPWMIEYGAVLVNRYLVGHDGKTAYERMKGKESKMLGFEFGERVNFRRIPIAGRLAKLESLWRSGIFVGYRSIIGEYMVVNEDGAFKTRNIKRVSVEDRWNKAEVEAIR